MNLFKKSLMWLHLEHASTEWFPVFKKERIAIENVETDHKACKEYRPFYHTFTGSMP